MNKGREYLRILKQVKKKKGDEPLTQEEIDILLNHAREGDKKNGIERKPQLGCIVSLLGSILVWSLIYWIWVGLS